MVDFGVGAATHEALEEAGSFDNFEVTFLDLTVLSIYDNIAVTLNTSDVVYVNV